jgi:hypothetical protein
MIWGFAGPWAGDFQMRNGEWIRDPAERFWHLFDFLTEHGFQCMGIRVHKHTTNEGEQTHGQ